MMKRILSTLVVLLTAASALSEDRQVIPLWGDSEPPYAKPHSIKEYQDDNCWGNVSCIHQVVTPTLTLYLPEGEPNGTVVVALLPRYICLIGAAMVLDPVAMRTAPLNG